MNHHAAGGPVRNPFSAQQIRPGRIPYHFPPGQTAAGLVERLRSLGWWGQIVGPHGSGKSALVAALIPWIEQAGRTTLLVELHDGQRRMPWGGPWATAPLAPSLVIVDGYEQLAPLSRWRLRRTCRRHVLGLLVTAHQSMGLPDLARTATSLGQAQALVRQLLGGSAGITAADVAARFHARQGNVREMLFDLYDLFEQRCRGEPSCSA